MATSKNFFYSNPYKILCSHWLNKRVPRSEKQSSKYLKKLIYGWEINSSHCWIIPNLMMGRKQNYKNILMEWANQKWRWDKKKKEKSRDLKKRLKVNRFRKKLLSLRIMGLCRVQYNFKKLMSNNQHSNLKSWNREWLKI